MAQAINPLAPPINLLQTVLAPKLGEKKVQVRKGRTFGASEIRSKRFGPLSKLEAGCRLHSLRNTECHIDSHE